ncbi:MAG: hypothetical protein ABIH38_03330 [Patescibacteria group bacterium]
MNQILPSENPAKKSKKILYGLLIGMAAIILLGICLGYWYNQLPKNNPQRSQYTCEQAGGQWLVDESTCLISNRLAGEACTDGGQCQSGVCFPPDLTEEHQAAVTRGEKVSGLTGTCYPEELIGDCVKQILKGTVSRESLCIE